MGVRNLPDRYVEGVDTYGVGYEPDFSNAPLEEENITADDTTEQLENLAQQCLTHFDWAKQSTDRQDFEDRCQDVQRFWLGKQWDGVRSFNVPARSADRKRLKPCPVDNFFKAQIEGLVGDICDAPADVQISPQEPEDEQIAEAMSQVYEHVSYVNKFNRQLEYIVRRGVMYGPLIGKVLWDMDWVGGMRKPYVGEIKTIGVSPNNFFLDPRIKATEPEALQQAAFMIYAVPRSLAYLKSKYPWAAENLMPDDYASYVTTLTGDGEEMYVSDDDTSVLVIEYWYSGAPKAPNYPVEVSKTHQPFTDAKGSGVHLCTMASGIVLQHVQYAAPVFPFAMDWIYPSDESSYGYGDGYDMLLPQLMINKLNEIAMEGHSVQSIGNWLVGDGAIRDTAQFQKYASMGGTVLPVTDISQVQRVTGGGIPSTLFTHYNQEQRALETVSGRVDISQGRSPRGIRAASAISLLLQQAAGRIRQRSRAVSSFVQQMVQLMTLYAGHYYDNGRLLRATSVEGKLTWVEYSRDNVIRMVNYTNPMTNETITFEYIPEFDILVNVGAETPVSKAYYAEMAMDLFGAKVIDDVALLEIVDFPRWRSIKQRMNQGGIPQGGEEMPGQFPGQGQPQPQQGGADPTAQIKQLLNALVNGQISLDQVPPQVLQIIVEGIKQGKIDPKIFPPEIASALLAKAQGGGAPRPSSGAAPGGMANPMNAANTAAGGRGGDMNTLKGFIGG